MIKRCLQLIAIFVLSFIYIDFVSARTVNCDYKGITDDNDKYEVSVSLGIDLDQSDIREIASNAIYHDPNGEIEDFNVDIRVINIYKVWDNSSWNIKNNYFREGSKTFKEYYEKNGVCPPYLTIFTVNDYYAALNDGDLYFSDGENVHNSTNLEAKLAVTNPTFVEDPKPKLYCNYKVKFNTSDYGVEDYLIHSSTGEYEIDYGVENGKDVIALNGSTVVKPEAFKTDKCEKNPYVCVYFSLSQFHTFIASSKSNMLKNISDALYYLQITNNIDSSMSEDQIYNYLKNNNIICMDSDGNEKEVVQGKSGCSYIVNTTKGIDISDYSTYFKTMQEIRNYCNVVVSNDDYTDVEGSCIYECLNIDKYVLVKNNDGNGCGMPDRLMNWIDNILKWIKYILPALVIIFGIIDFIKAFTSGKDDEIKKSQKKFIIRLISAALAFLIPFIIEFILEKMGFISEFCGLW